MGEGGDYISKAKNPKTLELAALDCISVMRDFFDEYREGSSDDAENFREVDGDYFGYEKVYRELCGKGFPDWIREKYDAMMSLKEERGFF